MVLIIVEVDKERELLMECLDEAGMTEEETLQTLGEQDLSSNVHIIMAKLFLANFEFRRCILSKGLTALIGKMESLKDTIEDLKLRIA